MQSDDTLLYIGCRKTGTMSRRIILEWDFFSYGFFKGLYD